MNTQNSGEPRTTPSNRMDHTDADRSLIPEPFPIALVVVVVISVCVCVCRRSLWNSPHHSQSIACIRHHPFLRHIIIVTVRSMKVDRNRITEKEGAKEAEVEEPLCLLLLGGTETSVILIRL